MTNTLRPVRIATVLMLTALPLLAHAGLIRSPDAILANTAGNFVVGAEVENAFNGSGLTPGFSSGVTDFDSYLAGNPTHTATFSGFEWFSNGAGHVDLDMGSAFLISRLAIWNEEGGNGVGALEVFASADDSFSVLSSMGAFNPAQNAPGAYGAEVLDLTDTTTRYLRLVLAPNGNEQLFGLGEIAFDSADAGAVPEPGSLALVALSLLGLGRRRSAVAGGARD